MKTWQFWTITALYYGTLVTKALKWSMILNKKRILNIITLPSFRRSKPVNLLTEAQKYTELQLLTENDIRQIVKSTQHINKVSNILIDVLVFLQFWFNEDWAVAMLAKMFLVLLYMEIVFSMKGLLLLFVLLLLHQT